MIQLRRASTSDPLLRVAFGCDAFIERALEDPAWGALVARMARSNPSVGETTRRRLKEDLARVLDALPGGGLSVDLAWRRRPASCCRCSPRSAMVASKAP